MLPHPPRRAPLEGASPPNEVRITELRPEPWPDGQRVRVQIAITPFQENPNLEAILIDRNEVEIARSFIVETASNRIVFTMHIRNSSAKGPFTLKTNLTYPSIGVVDERIVTFEIHDSGGDT